MHVIRSIVTYFMVAVSLAACNIEPREKSTGRENGRDDIPAEARSEKALMDEVIAIHDEAMPKIEEIVMLKSMLQNRFDSLMFEEADPEEIKLLQVRIKDLRSADSAMMNWMRQFKPVGDTINHEKRIEYLQNERERIIKVREMMNTSIEEAREVVK